LAAGYNAAANGSRSETGGPGSVKASHAKAAPSSSTADTRQTQTNEESEAEGPFGPMKGAPWDRKCPRRYLVRTAGNQCDS